MSDPTMRVLARQSSMWEPGDHRKLYPLHDGGNAAFFADTHKGTARYCQAEERWYIYDGRRWATYDQKAVERYARQVAKLRKQMALSEADRTAGERFAIYSGSAQGLLNMVRLAQSEEELTAFPEDFDQDFYLLNTLNGTYNLETGEFYDHQPSDMISKVIPVRYDPSVRCPRWESYLVEMFDGNEEIAQFLKRAIGYSLSGDTSEPSVFILHGIGRNGKSTFINVLRKFFGKDYATNLPIETLMKKRNPDDTTATPYLAALKGMRLVESSEPELRMKLNEGLVKQLTGTDHVKARFLNQNPIEFQPQFKLWVACNHEPEIQGLDDGIWGRVKLIPFAVNFEKRGIADGRLRWKLEAAEALTGILTWAIEGYREWRAGGLQAPEAVRVATQAYKFQMNEYARFLYECTVDAPGTNITTSELLAEFQKWQSDNGKEPEMMDPSAFGRRLNQEPGMLERHGQHPRTRAAMYKNMSVRTPS